MNILKFKYFILIIAFLVLIAFVNTLFLPFLFEIKKYNNKKQPIKEGIYQFHMIDTNKDTYNIITNSEIYELYPIYKNNFYYMDKNNKYRSAINPSNFITIQIDEKIPVNQLVEFKINKEDQQAILIINENNRKILFTDDYHFLILNNDNLILVKAYPIYKKEGLGENFISMKDDFLYKIGNEIEDEEGNVNGSISPVDTLKLNLNGIVTYLIKVEDNYFYPKKLYINVGERIQWINYGNSPHNVNGDINIFPENPEPFYNGEASNKNWSYIYSFDTSGTYNYQCDQHASMMSGSIIVNNKSSDD